MRKTINGKTYDTDKAERVAVDSARLKSDIGWWREGTRDEEQLDAVPERVSRPRAAHHSRRDTHR